MTQQTVENAAPTAVMNEQQVQAAGQIQQPPSPEKTVPLEAHEALRREGQAAKAEAERQRIRADILEQAAAQRQAPPAPQYDPEDVPLVKDVRSMIQEEVGKVRTESRQDRVALMVKQAKADHTDYDEVFALAYELAEQNPESNIAQIILESPNPAEAAYRFGKTHPSYLEKSKQQAAQTVTDKINENLGKVGTLSEAGGGGAPSIETDWREKAGTPEMRAKIDRVMRGGH